MRSSSLLGHAFCSCSSSRINPSMSARSFSESVAALCLWQRAWSAECAEGLSFRLLWMTARCGYSVPTNPVGRVVVLAFRFQDLVGQFKIVAQTSELSELSRLMLSAIFVRPVVNALGAMWGRVANHSRGHSRFRIPRPHYENCSLLLSLENRHET